MTQPSTKPTDVLEIPVGQQADGTVPTTEPPAEGDTFPREYVERLRSEAADHRTARKAAEEALEPLQQRLFAMEVEKTGRLADPSDLAFDPALLDDGLDTAIDALLEAKPHLASRLVSGDVGQGAGQPTESFSLAGLLSDRA